MYFVKWTNDFITRSEEKRIDGYVASHPFIQEWLGKSYSVFKVAAMCKEPDTNKDFLRYFVIVLPSSETAKDFSVGSHVLIEGTYDTIWRTDDNDILHCDIRPKYLIGFNNPKITRIIKRKEAV